MLVMPGATDRAALLNLSIPGLVPGVPREDNNGQLSLSSSSRSPLLCGATWTLSEPLELSGTSEGDEGPPALTTAAAARVVDVDAVDSETAEERSDAPQSVAALPPDTQRLRTTIRDAVIVSYDSWGMEAQSSACAGPDVCGLLSVAADGSRLFFRRSRPCPTSLPRATVDGGSSGEGGLRVQAWPSSVRARGRELDSDVTPAPSGATLPLFTTRWHQEGGGVLLPEAQGQILRVRQHGGAQWSSVVLSHPGSAQSRCSAAFVALSSAAVSLVQSRDSGVELTPLHHVPFDADVVVNATCLDDWGSSGSVVGFSDGTVRVVDWRTPAEAALTTRVPQPRWLGVRRRGTVGFASVAGVLSCCALSDSFRVVCGLGDASGAVAVADLRRPDPLLDRKRGRRSDAEKAVEGLLFGEAGGFSPTGRAVTDMARDPSHFGGLLMVDLRGRVVHTHISSLEGCAATPSLARYELDLGCEEDVGGDAVALRPSSSVLNSVGTASGGASRPRQRLPSPPPPWQVLARTQRSIAPAPRTSGAAGNGSVSGAGGHAENSALLSSQGFVATSRPRCIVTADGRHVVNTEPAGGGVTAVVQQRHPIGTARSATRLCSHQRSVGRSLSTCVAVSSVEDVVCFDMSDGATLSVVLR